MRFKSLVFLAGTVMAARLGAQTPVITALTPPATTAGANTLTVIVTGSSFLPFDPVSATAGTALTWSFGSFTAILPVQYVNATTLRATVAASLLTTPGTATITPSNPAYSREWRFNYVNIPATGNATLEVRLKELSSSADNNLSDATGHFTTLTRTVQTAAAAGHRAIRTAVGPALGRTH